MLTDADVCSLHCKECGRRILVRGGRYLLDSPLSVRDGRALVIHPLSPRDDVYIQTGADTLLEVGAAPAAHTRTAGVTGAEAGGGGHALGGGGDAAAAASACAGHFMRGGVSEGMEGRCVCWTSVSRTTATSFVVSSCCNTNDVLILLHMCPHASIYVSSY